MQIDMLADVSRDGPLADISRSERHLRFSNRQQSGLQCQRRRRAETERFIAQAASDSFVPLPSLTGTAAPAACGGQVSFRSFSCRFYLISLSTRMRIDIGTAPTAKKTNEIATGQADYSRSEPCIAAKPGRFIFDRSSRFCLPVHGRFVPESGLEAWGATSRRRVEVGQPSVIQAPQTGSFDLLQHVSLSWAQLGRTVLQ